MTNPWTRQAFARQTRHGSGKTLELSRPHLPHDALISDIGCGFGTLLSAFKAIGFSRLHGIDPAPTSAISAAHLFGLEHIRTGSLRDAIGQLPLDETDLLCLTGVAEHLPCLGDDFGCLLKALPERAMILIEVPALERFLAPPGEAYGEFSLEHIQYFSSETLTRLMAVFGFSPQALSICEFQGCTDSLFGLFSRQTRAGTALAPTTYNLADYLDYSALTLQSCLQKISDHNTSFAIFGAGSHTARLLPQLEQLGLASRIIAIVDNNPNLRGKKLGDFIIQPGDFLATIPGCPVLISSFNAQSAHCRTTCRASPEPPFVRPRRMTPNTRRAALFTHLLQDFDRIFPAFPLPELAGQRIFVTGGSGFIGFWLATRMSLAE